MQTPAQRAQWRATLGQLEAATANTPYRALPSSFDSEDEALCIVPRPLQHQWPSVTQALESVECSGLMTRLPLFWQLEAPLFEAARNASAFIFVNEADNMPLGMAALAQANVDAIITTAKDANDFFSFLLTHSALMPRVWIVIHPIESLKNVAPRPGVLCQEVHIIPGVPAFTQCRHLAAHRTESRYHLAETCTLTHDGLEVRSDVFPFVYPTTLSVTRDGSCSCGRETFVFGHA